MPEYVPDWQNTNIMSTVPNPLLHKAILVVITIVAAWSLYHTQPIEIAQYAVVNHSTAEQTATALIEPAEYKAQFASRASTALVHASTITELNDGRLLAMWFAGSREGAKDVVIHGAYFDPKTSNWSDEKTFASPEQSAADLNRYIKKVGNPVLTVAKDNKLWLFYVTVSLGGWATSHINAMYSTDNGDTWSQAKRLVATPFLNVSTLVKGTPIHYENGEIGLPVYHELAGKFGEILVLSPEGEVIRKERLDYGRHSLQPVIFLQSPTEAMAFMRNAKEVKPYRALRTQTKDKGLTWSPVEPSSIDNPNSAVAGLALSANDFISVLNDTEKSREQLTLATSSDAGRQWQAIYSFEKQLPDSESKFPPKQFSANLARYLTEQNASVPAALIAKRVEHNMCNPISCQWQFDYPYIIRTKSGDFHLVYTWNKSMIKHIEFNLSWLESVKK